MESRASLLLRMRIECAVHDANGRIIEHFDEAGQPNLVSLQVRMHNRL